eukprot:scaffold9191_cov56-Phaeocystis_antarctica.AAC.3
MAYTGLPCARLTPHPFGLGCDAASEGRPDVLCRRGHVAGAAPRVAARRRVPIRQQAGARGPAGRSAAGGGAGQEGAAGSDRARSGAWRARQRLGRRGGVGGEARCGQRGEAGLLRVVVVDEEGAVGAEAAHGEDMVVLAPRELQQRAAQAELPPVDEQRAALLAPGEERSVLTTRHYEAAVGRVLRAQVVLAARVARVAHGDVQQPEVERDELVAARADEQPLPRRVERERVDRRAEQLGLLDGVQAAQLGAARALRAEQLPPLDDARAVGREEVRAIGRPHEGVDPRRVLQRRAQRRGLLEARAAQGRRPAHVPQAHRAVVGAGREQRRRRRGGGGGGGAARRSSCRLRGGAEQAAAVDEGRVRQHGERLDLRLGVGLVEQRAGVPHLGRAVGGDRHEPRAVGAPRELVHRAVVRVQQHALPAAGHVVERQQRALAVGERRGEQRAVGAQRERGGAVGARRQRVQQRVGHQARPA